VELDTPTFRAPLALPVKAGSDTANPGSVALAPVRQAQDFVRLLDTILRARELPASPTMPGPFVGLKDAVALSGMPASWLLAQANAGVPWAINVGTGKKKHWRFSIAGKSR
jgi:hypothetical protein